MPQTCEHMVWSMPCFSIMGMDSMCSPNSSGVIRTHVMFHVFHAGNPHQQHLLLRHTSVLGPQGQRAPIRGSILFWFKGQYCKQPSCRLGSEQPISVVWWLQFEACGRPLCKDVHSG